MEYTSYELTMTHDSANKNWILKYNDKTEAVQDYNFFHKLGMSVILRERITTSSSTSKVVTADWNRHLNKVSKD